MAPESLKRKLQPSPRSVNTTVHRFSWKKVPLPGHIVLDKREEQKSEESAKEEKGRKKSVGAEG